MVWHSVLCCNHCHRARGNDYARVKDLESAIIIRNEWLIERNILNAELAAEKIKSNKPEFAIIRQQTLIYFD